MTENAETDAARTASHATISSVNASRYLQQLCKHWSHRFAVTFTPERGSIDFGAGDELALVAQAGQLHLVLLVGQSADLTSMQGVVAEHLSRFAFREALSIDWTPGKGPVG